MAGNKSGGAKVSKNNQAARAAKGAVHQYAGRQIVPVKFVEDNTTFMAASYKDNGELVYANTNDKLPLAWADCI